MCKVFVNLRFELTDLFVLLHNLHIMLSGNVYKELGCREEGGSFSFFASVFHIFHI